MKIYKVIDVIGYLLVGYGAIYSIMSFFTLRVFSLLGGIILVVIGLYIVRFSSKTKAYYQVDPTEEQLLIADALEISYPTNVTKQELEVLIDKAKSELL
jgi:hypothetical protein